MDFFGRSVGKSSGRGPHVKPKMDDWKKECQWSLPVTLGILEGSPEGGEKKLKRFQPKVGACNIWLFQQICGPVCG